MPNFAAPLAAGLLAGFIHVLSGPDHLAAIAPLAVGQRKRPWLAGFRWALGHSAGVFIVAGAAWLLRGLLPIDRYSNFSERLVGVALIAIGIWGTRKALRLKIHAHVHTHGHGQNQHMHLHVHNPHSAHASAAIPPAGDAAAEPPPPHVHTHAAMGMGVLHGVAGNAHFLGVLPALALATKAAAGVYLLAFGAATVAAMSGFSAVIGLTGTRLVGQAPYLYRSMMLTCSLAAIAIGGFWMLA